MPKAPPQPTPAPATESLQQRVRELALEVEKLAASSLPPDKFFPLFLERLVKAIAATAGAVWMLKDGKFQLNCAIRLKSTGIPDSVEIQRYHHKLLNDISANCQTRFIHTDDVAEPKFPRPHLLILTALMCDDRCVGVVEIFQRPDTSAAARPGYMQYVEQMAGYASLYLQKRTCASTQPVASPFDDELGRFGLQLQRSMRVQDVAAVVANDGRLLVGCDRLTVITRRGKRIRALAVSGQESIHHRSNLIKAQTRLAREAIVSGVPVKYSGNADDFPPQVRDCLADFVQESGARLVFVLPLVPPPPLVAVDPQSAPRPQPFGCLVLERFDDSEPTAHMKNRLDWLTAYSAASLYNVRTHQSLFLLPLWRALGNATEWLHGRKFLQLLMAVALVAATAYTMMFVKMDFRVDSTGRLMPAVRREVFVPYDGDVVDVLVASGDRVQAGQLLVKLRNNELRSEQVAIESQYEEKLKLQSALTAERDELSKGPTGDRLHRIEGELAKNAVELRGLERRRSVLADRVRQLDITSPIDGVVSTFEVDRLLRYRPVRRGEILLEVMDDNGPWQLELDVDQHRSGHMLRAQAESAGPLPIEYLQVTAPEQTYQATLKDVGTRVVAADDNRSVVELLGTLNDDQVHTRRIGAEVRARIHCGRKPVGYVLFGDVIEFVQKYLWL